MGDLTVTTTKPKESSCLTIQCPMLTTTNYTVWSMRMKVALKVHKAWETIEPGQGDADKNDLARALLFQSIHESLIIQVGNLETSKELWEAVKARHVGADRVREARLQTLMDEFSRMKMRDTGTIDDFSGKLAKISSESSALGEDIEEFKLVKKFLNSLPRAKYIHIIVALEQVLNLNLTTFEDIVGRLKAYKERIQIEDQQEDHGKLMYANMDSQPQQESYGRGNSHTGSDNYSRGRGRRGRSGYRGRGRNNGQRNWTQGRDASRVVCYRCDKTGTLCL